MPDELTTSYEVVPQSPQNLSNHASNSQIRLDHGRFTSIDTMQHIENTDILTSVHSPLQPDEYTIEGERRSRMVVFLGFSKQHANTVGMVLNLSTGHVSPQWNLIYDNSFETAKDTFKHFHYLMRLTY